MSATRFAWFSRLGGQGLKILVAFFLMLLLAGCGGGGGGDGGGSVLTVSVPGSPVAGKEAYFIAVEDGPNGEWQQVGAGAAESGQYVFGITDPKGRYRFAYVCYDPADPTGSFDSVLLNITLADTKKIAPVCLFKPRVPVSGTATNYDSGTTTTVRVGTGYAELALGSADYSLRAEPGVHTLVAVDEAPSLDDPPTVLVRRGVTVPQAGTTIPTIDYSMGAQAAGPFKLSIASDLDTGEYASLSADAEIGDSTFFESVALLGQYWALPASQRTKDDDYAMSLYDNRVASLWLTRSLTVYRGEPQDYEFKQLPPFYADVKATRVGATLQFDFGKFESGLDGLHERFYEYTVRQSGAGRTVYWSPAWLGDGQRYRERLPDLTSVDGWRGDWALQNASGRMSDFFLVLADNKPGEIFSTESARPDPLRWESALCYLRGIWPSDGETSFARGQHTAGKNGGAPQPDAIPLRRFR